MHSSLLSSVCGLRNSRAPGQGPGSWFREKHTVSGSALCLSLTGGGAEAKHRTSFALASCKPPARSWRADSRRLPTLLPLVLGGSWLSDRAPGLWREEGHHRTQDSVQRK